MNTPLLQAERHHLHIHRIRGIPVFWIGFLALLLSLFGALARQDAVAPVRRFARSILDALPPGGAFWREHLYFAFPHPPFAAIATLIGLALLVWGMIELHAAGRIKDELQSAEEERRKRALVEEMEAERKKA
jgi:hypothetical protein